MNKIGHSKNKAQALSSQWFSFPVNNFIPAKSLDMLHYSVLIHSNLKNFNVYFWCFSTFPPYEAAAVITLVFVELIL